jgi:hypothetical protein
MLDEITQECAVMRRSGKRHMKYSSTKSKAKPWRLIGRACILGLLSWHDLRCANSAFEGNEDHDVQVKRGGCEHDLLRRLRRQAAKMWTSIRVRRNTRLLHPYRQRHPAMWTVRQFALVDDGFLTYGRCWKLGKSCKRAAHSLAGHAQSGRCLGWHSADGR